MTMLNPYISFHRNAREALEFYATALGGELTMSTFREFNMPGTADEDLDLIMHGMITTPGGLNLMASDTPQGMSRPDESFITISLSGDDEPALRAMWDGLADGGTVTMPLQPVPWGDIFGQLTDRFGVNWMVDILGASPADAGASPVDAGAS